VISINYPLTVSALLIGLASSIHCVGMCGGIIGALSYSLPDTVRGNRWRHFAYIAAYNLGRLASYALMGLLLGLLGKEFFGNLFAGSGHLVIRLLATLLIVLTGFYLAGWFPQFSRVERVGDRLWQRLAPLARRLIPVKSLPQGLLYGAVWGWLPCSLVYTVLLLSIASGGASQGMASMLAFGLGTLPSMVSTGLFASWLRRHTARPAVRTWIGVALIVIAAGSLLIPHEWLMPESSMPGYTTHEHVH